MADRMENVLLRVEEEQGTQLLERASWDRLHFYISSVGGTIVSQKDLADLLNLLQSSSQPANHVDQQPEQQQPQMEQEEQSNQDAYTHSLKANSFQELSDTIDNSETDTSLLQSEPEQPAYSESQLHPRHPSAIGQRPRATSAAFRKISLSESTHFRPRQHRVAHGSSPETSDAEENPLSSRVSEQPKQL